MRFEDMTNEQIKGLIQDEIHERLIYTDWFRSQNNIENIGVSQILSFAKWDVKFLSANTLNICAEIKSRTCRHDSYSSTMIEDYKIHQIKKWARAYKAEPFFIILFPKSNKLALFDVWNIDIKPGHLTRPDHKTSYWRDTNKNLTSEPHSLLPMDQALLFDIDIPSNKNYNNYNEWALAVAIKRFPKYFDEQ